jgi:spore germination protein YaaH
VRVVRATAVVLSVARSDPAPAAPPKRVFAFLSRVQGGLELTRLRQVGRRISVLAPNWYDVDVATAEVGVPSGQQSVLDAARRVRVPLWPVVNARTGADPAIDDPAARDRVVRALVNIASDRAYAGITLDVEELAPQQRDSFTALVRSLADALKARGRRLAVYVARPRGAGSSLAYDLPALAAAADLVLVATYNETSPNGPPGPLDTSRGFDDVLEQAAAVSRTKVAPILAAIGYAWAPGGGTGQMLSTVEAGRRAARCRAQPHVHDGNASYDCHGTSVYHATRAGLRARARKAGEQRFRWFALFSLGREPRAFWNGLPAVRR